MEEVKAFEIKGGIEDEAVSSYLLDLLQLGVLQV